MIHSPEYLKDLLRKHIEGRASAAEIEILLTALDLYDEEEITTMLEDIDPQIKLENYIAIDLKVPPFRKLQERINRASSSKARIFFRRIIPNAAVYAGAALLFLLFLWFINRPSKLKYFCGGMPGESESPTGIYSCRLILGSNCSVLIDSTYKGLITRQGNMEIIRLASGVLQYKKVYPGLMNDTTQRMFNTLTTSAGDQYQVILPDGTKVRLNAATSIRFPVSFSDTEREVVLDGEAFFEVAQDKNIPFCVKVKQASIRAFGTCFNVNAYSGNTIATLVCGSLEVQNTGGKLWLAPGQQAIIRHRPDSNTQGIIINAVDTTEAVSWKKVMRIYKDTPLKDFISDIARWYNLEMLNTGGVPDRTVSANLCYDTPLGEILKLLRAKGLHFRQEGKKIIIFSKDG